VKQLARSERYGWAKTLAYVVMPDHLHWLFELEKGNQLSLLVGSVKRHSAREISRLLNVTGGVLWQRGFHDHALRSEESLVAVARYIVANPLRAGLVVRVGDYPLWDACWL
jgi:putative transposase